MKNSLAFIVIGIVFFGSCKTEVTERDDYKRVMVVHDEAMTKMGQIHELKKTLKTWSEEASDSVLMAQSSDLIRALDEADEGMMSWMAEFRIPQSGSDEDLKKYFDSEQVKVDKVSLDINESITQAQNFIKNNIEQNK